MARLMFAVIAERVSADRFSNALDIHNVIEQIQVPAPPPHLVAKARAKKQHLAGLARLTLLLHWRRSKVAKPEGILNQRVQLVAPNGAILSSSEQPFSLREGNYVRNLVIFEVLPIAGEGTYTARISLKSGKRWNDVGETSFELVYAKAAPPEAKLRLQ